MIAENQGMVAGHYRHSEKSLKLLSSTLRLSLRMFRTASRADQKSIFRNAFASDGAQSVKWRKQVCQKANYYYIDLIAIAPSLKGSGAFRQLLEPILIRAKKEIMPVLLDTHDKNNVPLYEHFGFEVVGQYIAKHHPDLIQYAMVKWPHRAS